MSYEKHTWETGETITAEKLNNIEDGIDGANFIGFLVEFTLNMDTEEMSANKTYAEVFEAYDAGITPYALFMGTITPLMAENAGGGGDIDMFSAFIYDFGIHAENSNAVLTVDQNVVSLYENNNVTFTSRGATFIGTFID